METHLEDLFKDELDDIKAIFIEAGTLPDKSFKAIMTGFLKKIGTKIADDAGGHAAEAVGDYLGPIISGATKGVMKKTKQPIKRGSQIGLPYSFLIFSLGKK